MFRHFFFFLIILSIPSCTVYKVINNTGEDKKLNIGMKTNTLKNAQYYEDLIKKVKKINILNNNVQHHESNYIINYQINVPSKHSLRLDKLIHIYMLSYSYNTPTDSLNISLNSGKPILILSDSVIINNFKRINLIPWFEYRIEN